MALAHCQRWDCCQMLSMLAINGILASLSSYTYKQSWYSFLPHFASAQDEKLKTLRMKAKAKPKAWGACTYVALRQFLPGRFLRLPPGLRQTISLRLACHQLRFTQNSAHVLPLYRCADHLKKRTLFWLVALSCNGLSIYFYRDM